MLKFTFDPKKPYRAIAYLRMSSDKQNERSPDQQLAEIKKKLKALGYHWHIVKIYRDDAERGIYLRKRPGYQQMLQDVKTGTILADLVLVDNIERFGRVEELPQIRKELFDHLGILVVTADTNFCDPMTPQGKAIGTLEAWRASDANRIKALEVLRGKRDSAQRKFWPGGEPPFGYRLRTITSERNGKLEVEGSKLEPDPETGWIVTLLFDTAFRTSHGAVRLAKFLNNHPDIAEKYTPFYPATVGYWLQHEIYKGVLVWEKYCTGIVADMRVLQANPVEDHLVVDDFCPPLTTPEKWEAVNSLRQVRAAAITAARQRKQAENGKQIAAPARGLVLRYPLTGLARCGSCKRAMTPSSSRYEAKSGETTHYVSYVCPGYLAGVCPNQKRVPEDWLRQVVLRTLRQRFLGLPE